MFSKRARLTLLSLIFFLMLSVVTAQDAPSYDVSILVIDEFEGRLLSFIPVNDLGIQIYEVVQQRMSEAGPGCTYVVSSSANNEVSEQEMLKVAKLWYPDSVDYLQSVQKIIDASGVSLPVEDTLEPIEVSQFTEVRNPTCGVNPYTLPPEYATAEDLIQDIVQQIQNGFTELIYDELEDEGVDPNDPDAQCIGRIPEFMNDGQGNYIARGAGPDSPYPHGQIVLETIHALALKHKFTETHASPPEYDMTFVDTSLTERTMHILGEDAKYFSLQETQVLIEKHLTSNTSASWVVNTSFAVIPCSEVATFATYEALLATAPDVTLLMATVKALQATSISFPEKYNALDGDSFTDWPNAPWIDYSQVVMVASAGNIGLDYPFYPAAYKNVVSISSSPENRDFYSTLTLTDRIKCDLEGINLCSNAGEVLMPGIVDYGGYSWAGTSFAAPRFSLWAAVYLVLAEGRNTCGLLAEQFNNIPLDQLMPNCGPLQDVQMILP